MEAAAPIRPRWSTPATVLLGVAAAANVVAWVREAVVGGIHNDYSSALTLTYVGVHSGWSHIYDWEATRPVIHVFGSHFWPTAQNSDLLGNSNQYPPLANVLLVPLLYVPYEVGFFIWLAITALALLATWWLLAPEKWRLLNLFVMLASLPVGFALWLGQVVPLVAFSIGLSWWLLERRRDLLAGVVLVVIVIKPNLGILLPLALLLGGRKRAIWGAVGAGAIAAVVSFALIGTYGATQYFDHLRIISAQQSRQVIDPGLTMVGLFGIGPALLVADLVVVAAVAWTALTSRSSGPALGFAAAIVGSLLVTTYLHWQDLVMVLPAGWLWLRSGPGLRYAVPWLTVVLLVASFTVAVPQVLLAWLGLMVTESALRRRSPAAAAVAA